MPGHRHANTILAPLDSGRLLRTAGSTRRHDLPHEQQQQQQQQLLTFNRTPSTAKKALAASASMHQEVMRRIMTEDPTAHRREAEMRPSTSAPTLFRGAGGSFTSAPPRDLLASRGSQFRISTYAFIPVPVG